MDDDQQQRVAVAETADPAAVAFEALRQDVALLRAAMAGFAAEHKAMPDYSELLARIGRNIQATGERLSELAQAPAMRLTPDAVARQIEAAAAHLGHDDRAALQEARNGFHKATYDLRSWIASALQAREQTWRLGQAAAAAAVLGLMLGLWTPGAVARSAPERWAWPEKLAAHLMRSDLWSAGERMMAVGDAQRWQAMQSSLAMITENRDALEKCAQDAVKAGAEVKCPITVGPQGGVY